MYYFLLAILLAPIHVGERDNPYARSVPCCGQVSFDDRGTADALLVSAPKTPSARKRTEEPSASAIVESAREARFNTGLATTSKNGKASITLTPAKFPEAANVGDIARGKVLGELQTTGVNGLPNGRSTIYVALVDGEHHAYIVHDGKIVNRATAVVRKMDNNAESASVRLTGETGEVSPITICGRRFCVTITIKRKK